jgi:hypothetical protein
VEGSARVEMVDLTLDWNRCDCIDFLVVDAEFLKNDAIASFR